MKHTPGPWRTEVIGQTLRVTETAAEGKFHDDIAVLGDCRNELHQANARLIAAAPELLDACQAALACPALNMEDIEIADTRVIEKLMHAIGKAREEKS